MVSWLEEVRGVSDTADQWQLMMMINTAAVNAAEHPTVSVVRTSCSLIRQIGVDYWLPPVVASHCRSLSLAAVSQSDKPR